MTEGLILIYTFLVSCSNSSQLFRQSNSAKDDRLLLHTCPSEFSQKTLDRQLIIIFYRRCFNGILCQQKRPATFISNQETQ